MPTRTLRECSSKSPYPLRGKGNTAAEREVITSSQHPGEGQALPIDAHPEPLTRRGLEMGGGTWNFSNWGSRYQMFDATFGLEDTDVLRLPFRGSLPGAINDPRCLPPGPSTTTCQFWTEYAAQPGVPIFDDRNTYWFTGTCLRRHCAEDGNDHARGEHQRPRDVHAGPRERRSIALELLEVKRKRRSY